MDHDRLYQFPFAKYPALRMAMLISMGIIVDHSLNPGIQFWIGSFFLTAGCYATLEFLCQKAVSLLWYRKAVSFYLLLAILFGGTWSSINATCLQSRIGVPETYAWEALEFRGELEQIRQSSTGKYHLDIEVDSTFFPDSILWMQTYRLRAILDSSEATLANHLSLGSRLAFQGVVYPLEGKRNPYEFDYNSYLASQNIYTQAGINHIIHTRPPADAFTWFRLRQQVLNLINHNFDSETTSLAKALLIGYKNELNRDEKLAFSRAGLSHIMAVSGLHVGFILAPFWFLIPYFWTLRWGKQAGLVLLVLMLFTYAGLTGFTASVTRASITGGFIMYGRLFHKVRDSKNLTAVAAVIILLLNPAELFEIGFQLSFSAVYIILLTMPVLNSWLPLWLRHRWYAKPLQIVMVSMVVQAGLFPILTYYFGEFSLAGPLINALIVPFLAVVVPYALLLLPVAAVFSETAQWLNMPNSWFLNLLENIVHTASAIKGSWISIHTDSLLTFLVWTSALFVVSTLNIPRLRWKYTALFLTMICIQQSTAIWEKLSKPHLQITVFDVGQGDATLIQTPHGKNILIDAGRWSPNYNSARHVILPHLKSAGIKKLNAVFLSHPHADHIGGITELIPNIPIDTIYNSGYAYDSQLYHSYLSLARKHNVPVISLAAGDSVPLDSAIRIFIYGPQQTLYGADPNEHSIVMEVIYGSTELMFTGDAGIEQERRLLSNFDSLTDTGFLKVGHHGSRTSSSTSFLSTITPQQAVVSLAMSNRFGHPHAEAMQRLHQSQAQLYFTSIEGALIFYSDGDTIIYQPWK